jgi:tRNA-dihydrouridine synthase B
MQLPSSILERLQKNPFILAPMEAVNCASFRVLCKRRGAEFVFTDMIDADDFVAKANEVGLDEAVKILINPQDEEADSLVIQLGGANLENILFTIRAVAKYAVWIDYNLGCPLTSMLGKKGGVYLMKHPNQLYPKVSAIVGLCDELGKPFSVKLRAGWDEDSLNAVEIAKELEKLGVALVTIHPRTRKQLYKDRANWQLARDVKSALSIPVILSGDVTNAYMAHMAFAHVKCDAIMCARGAKHNPSLFRELKSYYATRIQPVKPLELYVKSTHQAQNDFYEWLSLYKSIENRYRLSEIIDHARWTIRGAKNAAALTEELGTVTTEDKIKICVSHLIF